jgi:hypothetical protein
MVKLWEMHQEFALEGLGQLKYGNEGGEPRMWLTGGYYSAFNASPFMLRSTTARAPNRVGVGAEREVNVGQTWYHLQLAAHAGRATDRGHRHPAL